VGVPTLETLKETPETLVELIGLFLTTTTTLTHQRIISLAPQTL